MSALNMPEKVEDALSMTCRIGNIIHKI